MSPGEILGSRLNRQLSERGSQRLVRYAAMASAGIGPGFPRLWDQGSESDDPLRSAETAPLAGR